MRPYGYKAIYIPGYGFSDKVCKAVAYTGFGIAALLAVLAATAWLMS